MRNAAAKQRSRREHRPLSCPAADTTAAAECRLRSSSPTRTGIPARQQGYRLDEPIQIMLDTRLTRPAVKTLAPGERSLPGVRFRMLAQGWAKPRARRTRPISLMTRVPSSSSVTSPT